MKGATGVAVAILLFGLVANAQSVAALLQKGIYNHETVGDLDAAIRSTNR